MSEYAGETIAKKVSRVRLYRRVKQMLKAVGREKDPKVLFLAGPEAKEVGCLKYILQAKPENCMAVDSDPDACRHVNSVWPGVIPINKPLQDALPMIVLKAKQMGWDLAKGDSKNFDFIHLDLMGSISEERAKIYGLYSLLSSNGSIAASTFFRGRENGIWAKMLTKTETMISERKGDRGRLTQYVRRIVSPDPKRIMLHLVGLENETLRIIAQYQGITEVVYDRNGAPKQRIQEMIAEELSWWAPIAGHSYVGESPMGVVAAQLRPGIMKSVNSNNLWWKEANNLSRHAVSVIPRDSKLELLKEVESVEKDFSKDETAEIFGTTKQTIAAWKAHRTMGTYE